jgi:DNA-directed RNA polymerase subunit RPC12/RpoP
MDLRRNVKCSGCGNEISFLFNGNIELTQMSAVGKCPYCSATVQMDFTVVDKTGTPIHQQQAAQSASSSSSPIPNLDDALSFDIPSNALKNLME